ncbi:hypothetical protein EDD85DRAFT_795196 [Armillaria nabsnona]|nr:hypothetical protein EDD85DRAFT_795196 [Armillaria nabsnona]
MCRKGVDFAIPFEGEERARLASELEAQESVNVGVSNLSLYIPACSLETMCPLGFGRNFGYESSDIQTILGSWCQDAQQFVTFPGFVALRLIGMFPWIAKLPIAAFQEDGLAKKVIQRVSAELLKRHPNPNGRAEGIIDCTVGDAIYF